MIDKYESRRIRAEIRQVLLTVWDPIGVADEPNAQDGVRLLFRRRLSLAHQWSEQRADTGLPLEAGSGTYGIELRSKGSDDANSAGASKNQHTLAVGDYWGLAESLTLEGRLGGRVQSQQA